MSKILLSIWIFIGVVLFIYSYGFVDLNLTLSSNPILFNFVTTIQHLVYFDRQLSINVFIGLILAMFILYLVTLRYFDLREFPWKLVIIFAVLLSLAYPMLSSDVFKYLFSAKEILVYHANPYLITPNSFPDDTWIRFMRWVHTTTPYGPVFTGLTIPYYLIGMGKFVPILYLFKLAQAVWYLVCIWLIGKMTKSVKAQLFFAFNPLIIMEWLINAHNDAIMLTLLLGSVYLFTLQKRGWSLLALLLSVGIKYVTLIFLPIMLIPNFFKKHFNIVIYYLIIVLAGAPLLYHYSWQYQPWYVTWIIPLAALVPSRFSRFVVAAYSLSVFSRYYYFVSTGSWLGTPLWHALATFLPPVIVAIIVLCSGFQVSKNSSGSQY